MDTHFLFNFIRFVCGEQVFVTAHLFSYADFAVEIYSTSTPFRVLACNRQINHRIALHPENVRKYKQKRSVQL